MKQIFTLLLFLMMSLTVGAQEDDTINIDLDFISHDDKKLFRMDNYFSRKTQRNRLVGPRSHRIISLDPLTNNYQEINVKDISSAPQSSMQQGIKAIDGRGKEHYLTPDSVYGFFTRGDYYFRRTITFNGATKTVFLRREDLFRESDVRVFSYEDERDETHYYAQVADGETLPMIDDDGNENIDAIRQRFLQNEYAKDKGARRMIAKMKPTADGVRKVYKALTHGSYSHYPHFRWGVTANVGVGHVNTDSYELDGKLIATGGLFADIPIAGGFSVHPELQFGKLSVKGTMKGVGTLPSSVAYNRTEISFPLMLRYTHFAVHGNVIPFVQLGMGTSHALKQNCDYRQVASMAYDKYGLLYSVLEGSDEISDLHTSVVGGVGAEWVVSNKRSLFLELRYAEGISKLGHSDFMLVVGLNL
ncbi:MAG: PorT family protein [Bacteroidaceae bacterium]|nr:PorT family protein [Bacteroidaceae bacterium]